MKINVVILAGGLSERFGKNKLLVNIDKEPMIKRVIEKIEPISSEIFCPLILKINLKK